MRKIVLWAVVALMAVAIAAVPALAANPHTNPQTLPLFCDTNNAGTVVTCGGELAGLGNVDFIDVVVDMDAGCATKRSAHEPPGHFQVVDEDIPVTKSGRATFSTQVAPDCPPGLNEAFGSTAFITVFEANTTNVLFTSGPITVT
jgi:hypothetical protein